MAWYNSSWLYRFKLTIDHTKVGADETDFPLLITEANCPAAFWAHVKSDGTDIVVTSSNGTTKLKRELVSITVGTPLMELWTKVTSLSSSSDTEIYVYYGYASAAESNDTEVWSDYVGVWHMAEDPSTTNLHDSTGNNDGVMEGGMTSGDLIDGKIGKCIEFDGADDAFDLGSITSANPLCLNGESFTATLWFNHLDDDTYQRILDKSSSGSFANGWGVMLNGTLFYVASTGDWGNGKSGGNHGTLYYMQGVFNDASNRSDYWRDGASLGGAADITSSISATTTDAHIGTWNHSTAREYKGTMDELRIANTTRDGDWAATEYASYNAPSTFYSCGGEETETVAWTDLIHGIANASVAKIHGVAKASIAKVLNG